MSAVPFPELIRAAKAAGDDELARELLRRHEEAKRAETAARTGAQPSKAGHYTQQLLTGSWREGVTLDPNAPPDPAGGDDPYQAAPADVIDAQLIPEDRPSPEREPARHQERRQAEPSEPEPSEPETRAAADAAGAALLRRADGATAQPWDPGDDSQRGLMRRRGGWHLVDGEIRSRLLQAPSEDHFTQLPHAVRIFVQLLAGRGQGILVQLLLELTSYSDPKNRPLFAYWGTDQETAERFSAGSKRKVRRETVSKGWKVLADWGSIRWATEKDHTALAGVYHRSRNRFRPRECKVLQAVDAWRLPADLAQELVERLNRGSK